MAKEIITIENLKRFKEDADETYQPKGDYATKGDIPDVSELEKQVETNTKDIEDLKAGEGVDLSDYAKTKDIEDGTIKAGATAGTLTIKLDDTEGATYPTATFNGSNATADVAGYVASLDYATKTYADNAASSAEEAAEAYTKSNAFNAISASGTKITMTRGDNTTEEASVSIDLSGYATTAKAVGSFNSDGTATITPVSVSGTELTPFTVNNVENATSAGTAGKLGSSNVGNITTPIYLASGTATECSDMANTLTGANASIDDTNGATLTFSRLGNGTAATAAIPLAGTTAGLMSAEDKANLDALVGGDYDSVLDNNSWATISRASKQGVASDIWNIGDTKTIRLRGTMGTITLDQDVLVYIIGFDHNSALEGKNTIHFGTFKDPDAGTDICLIDDNYNSTSYSGTHYFNINHWGSSSSPYNTNYGGWAACDMRYDILGSTDNAPSPYGETKTTGATGKDPSSACATSPLDGTLLSCFPLDLREVMRPMTKYTDNVGNSSTSYEAVTATQDYLPLLAHLEILSSSSYPNSNEATFQERYEYYANGNSAVKYRHTATGSTATWWDRSPYCSTAYYFCNIYTNGGSGNNSTRSSYGVAPAFCV